MGHLFFVSRQLLESRIDVLCFICRVQKERPTCQNQQRLQLQGVEAAAAPVVKVWPLGQYFSALHFVKKIIDLLGGQINDPSWGSLLFFFVTTSNFISADP